MEIRAILRLAALFALTFLAANSACIAGVSAPIAIEGLYKDWDGISPAYTDPFGDNGSSAIDFGRLWLANDDKYLYLRIEVGTEIKLNSDNGITLYVDWDGDSETGFSIAGRGADFKWEFGSRSGTVYTASGQDAFNPAEIGLIRAPTVSSNQFEMQISRSPSLPIASAHTIYLLFRNEVDGVQDTLPDSGAVAYTFSSEPVAPYRKIPLEKENASDLRILTYNVLRDGLFERTQYFSRILKAIHPDILNFQEIYNHTAQETLDLVKQILPPVSGGDWYAAKNEDCITVSRFPILQHWALDGNLASLLDTGTISATGRFLIINAHLPCCSDDVGRQKEADHIMSFVRDAHTPGGDITLPARTPICLVGDWNMVGWAQELKTIITGDIIDNQTYGPDFHPDWDGTDLTDCISYHTATRDAYTWRNDGSSFTPGRLDFVVFTDSAIKVARNFILWTPTMSTSDLTKYGLEAKDVPNASDHLPHIADFRTSATLNIWMLH